MAILLRQTPTNKVSPKLIGKRPLSFLFNLFYLQLKWIAERHLTRRYRALHRLEMALLIAALVRILNPIYSMYRQAGQQMILDDYFAKYLKAKPKLYDFKIGLTVLAFFVYTMLLQRVIFFRSIYTVTFDLMYDLTVNNFKIYQRCFKSTEEIRLIQERIVQRYSRLVKFPRHLARFIEPALRIVAKLSIILNFEHTKNIKMCYSTRLKLFRTMSAPLRKKLILLVHFANLVMLCCLLGSIPSMAIFYLFIYWDILLQFSPSLWLVLLDNVLLVNWLAVMYRNTLLFLFMGIFSSYPIQCHLTDCNLMLARVQATSHFNYFDHIRLRYFFVEHFTKAAIVIRSNRQIVCSLAFQVILSMVSSNIYLICRTLLYEYDMLFFERLLSVTIISAQLGGIALLLLLMAFCNVSFYRPAKYMANIQLKLDKKTLLKLKYDHFFAQLIDRRPQIGYSIGDMNKIITFRTILNVFLNYGIYLTCLFSLLLNSKLKYYSANH